MTMTPRVTPSRAKRRAFTLIELLVVLAVILLLLGLLIPSLRATREAARSVICTSQLRQIGTAFESYKAQHSELFPYADDSLDIPAGRIQPIDTLANHLGVPVPAVTAPEQTNSAAPWRCPSDPVIATRFGSSYRYELWQIFAIFGPQQQRTASRIATNGGAVVLMREALAFHSPSSDPAVLAAPKGRNYLRPDGAVATSK